MNIEAEIQKLLKEIGLGRMSSTAYDTAWGARLGEINWELGNRALEWICENQLPDGSWGAKDVFYYHDRVLCTLAALITLKQRGQRAYDKTQNEKGLLALERITAGATQGLAADPNGATVGFEMIVPTLVAEAEELGIIKQQGSRILGRLGQLRNAKMEKLAGRKINRFVTPAFSSEMAGRDGQSILDIDNLQEKNGSVANSPSATAYFALYSKRNDNDAMDYLRRVVNPDDGVPDFAPIDIFETAWTLWNLRLISDLDKETLAICQPHLDFLEKYWTKGEGIGSASNGTLKDGDDSGLVYDVLVSYGRKLDINAVLGYEETKYFRCFTLESNPSISANIHILGALHAAGFANGFPSVQKILNFLHKSHNSPDSWVDKWHISPYYVTSHAIILAHQYAPQMCKRAIDWLSKTQRPNGSWGFYEATAEETAYAIQALSIWKRGGGKVPREHIELGVNWLINKSEPPYPPLWIGKALYCPEFVVRSVILSAIYLGKQSL